VRERRAHSVGGRGKLEQVWKMESPENDEGKYKCCVCG